VRIVHLSSVPQALHRIDQVAGGMAIVTLFDNVQEGTTDEDGNMDYLAAMYQIRLPYHEGLKGMDYSKWLARVKELEVASSTADKRIARDTLL